MLQQHTQVQALPCGPLKIKTLNQSDNTNITKQNQILKSKFFFLAFMQLEQQEQQQ